MMHDNHDPESVGHVVLRGRASDQAVIYQQGSGAQYNIQHTELPQVVIQQSSVLSVIDYWPLVREVDPLDVGVHRAPIEQGNAVPAYVERDSDTDIRQQFQDSLATGGLTLIVGDSTAGKSRAAYECISLLAPDRRLLHPDDGASLRSSFAALMTRARECVLWLDDLELYLTDDGLTPNAISNLCAAGVPIMATMRAEQYRRHNTDDDAGHSHAEARSGSRLRYIVGRNRPFLLKRRWSSSEIDRASNSQDPRVQSAVEHAETFGVAEYLAAGPRLLEEFEMAGEGSQGHLRGGAIVSAAIDCARAGLDTYVPSELLRGLHSEYIDPSNLDAKAMEDFEPALAWATRRRYGATSLLVQGEGNRYRAFDYLTDSLMRRHDAPEIPRQVWEQISQYAISNASAGNLGSVAGSAFIADHADLALKCWKELAQGETDQAADSAIWVGSILNSDGKDDEALEWFAKASAKGDSEGPTRIALITYERGDHSSAMEALQVAANDGNAHAALHLGMFLEEDGKLSDAEYWYRRAALGDSQRHFALTDFAGILERSGDLEEAEDAYKKAVDIDVPGAKNSLALLALKTKGPEYARNLWIEAIEAGDPTAAENLARFHQERGEYAEAEHWLGEAVKARK